MNRSEALRILGLGEDATSEDVKIAYRETAQILHPDRFASNKKLQERANEQFKNLQEAYDVLTSGKASRSSSSRRVSSYEEAEIEAKLAGVSAARTQLFAQRDVALDVGPSSSHTVGSLVAARTARRRRAGCACLRPEARPARNRREHRRCGGGVGRREGRECAEDGFHPE